MRAITWRIFAAAVVLAVIGCRAVYDPETIPATPNLAYVGPSPEAALLVSMQQVAPRPRQVARITADNIANIQPIVDIRFPRAGGSTGLYWSSDDKIIAGLRANVLEPFDSTTLVTATPTEAQAASIYDILPVEVPSLTTSGKLFQLSSQDGLPLIEGEVRFAPVRAVISSADGNRAAVVDGNDEVYIYDLQSGQMISSFVHRRARNHYLSADGSIYAGASFNALQLWNTDTGTPMSTFGAAFGDRVVFRVAFNADMSRIAFFLNDQLVVGDVGTGRILKALAVGGVPEAIAFSRDDTKIATKLNGTIWIRDLETQNVLVTQGGANVDCLVPSPDGQRLLIRTTAPTARIYRWHQEGEDFVAQLDDIVLTPGSCPTYSDDGQYLAFAEWSLEQGIIIHILETHEWIERQTVRIYDQSQRRFYAQGAPAFAFSRDGRHIAVVWGGPMARVYDVESGQAVTQHAHPTEAYSVAYGPANELVVVGRNVIQVWAPEAGARADNHTIGTTIASQFRGTYRAFPNGITWLWWQSGQSRVIYHIPDGQAVYIPQITNFERLAIAQGEPILAVAVRNGLQIWDTNIGQKLHDVPLGFASSRLAFSPDLTWIAVDQLGGLTRIYAVDQPSPARHPSQD